MLECTWSGLSSHKVYGVSQEGRGGGMWYFRGVKMYWGFARPIRGHATHPEYNWIGQKCGDTPRPHMCIYTTSLNLELSRSEFSHSNE